MQTHVVALGLLFACGAMQVATAQAASLATRDCDLQMRKTFEALQAWRRTHNGSYPDRLADLALFGLMPRDAAICPNVLGESAKSDPAHPLATSRGLGRDPLGSYEYELTTGVEISRHWMPADAPPHTRQELKLELLRRPFHEQVAILRCASHRAAAPAELAQADPPMRNLTITGAAYWSDQLWEQQWLADVPYCCREANVLFGLKGPPFHIGRSPALSSALDLRPWVCACGDHAWWWTYPLFTADGQKTPQLHGFFKDQPGRIADVAGIQFWIDGLVQLQGRLGKDLYKEPARETFVWERKGLEVGRKFRQASWLQGAIWAAPRGESVGWLVWHYSDGRVERTAIIYGETTGRFWGDPAQVESEPQFPTPAWKLHETAAEVGKERWVRLYLQTWENPRPDTLVTALDFVSNRNSPASPFLVAINLTP